MDSRDQGDAIALAGADTARAMSAGFSPYHPSYLAAVTGSFYDSNGERYYLLMIAGFADRNTERLFNRERVRRFPSTLHGVTRRKLLLLDAALALLELRVPPRNRLEKLRGDRAGQHGIRVNQQWRVCFRWRDVAAFGVEIVDYH